MKTPAYKWVYSLLFVALSPLHTSVCCAFTSGTNTAFKQNPPSAPHIAGWKKVNATTVAVSLTDGRQITVDFYGDQIFRLFEDKAGQPLRDPQATPEAHILVNNPRRKVSKLNVADDGKSLTISNGKINAQFNKQTTLLEVTRSGSRIDILKQVSPVHFDQGSTGIAFQESPSEYFYGGGVQNGRFSHKGKVIAIENQNSWTDGGVASPTPFFWSSNGYGILWHTFKKGKYDFGKQQKGIVSLSHETDYLDMFVMIDNKPETLLQDFYQLTGNPVLLPKFGFYEGHLNAYNRDYWQQNEQGILFEDGKRYKESQKDNGGQKESLNGEHNNYQFSARAVIDRYKRNDMPLGWLLPNDGYGAGYGQGTTLDENISNLKSLGDYARKNGVQIGLWTQSDLHPKPGVSALLQRDIIKEVKDAGVRVLKTDVAWVGAGYSFGLHGVSDVAQIMTEQGKNARPFIISLDGWAGTQRYASVWSGDQTGGMWEYIRFHIPTYLGAGLSGQPNITSDMDGIFGGKNPIINARDFEWKAFTPMQLNMDGWGANEKYPHALGEPAASINRNYLKLKSELLPYTYSVASEAVNGLPLMRAIFLEYPNAFTQGTATQYQYLYGPNFLVAPIYKATKTDEQGNDIRNDIYLPRGVWIDYFTGERYEGNKVYNHFAAPVWKLPLFVKAGAIIPTNNPNNNVAEIDNHLRSYEIYPYGKSRFTTYDDDGLTEAYKTGKGVRTEIESAVTASGSAVITVHATNGDYPGFQKEKATLFKINASAKPKAVHVRLGQNVLKLHEVFSKELLEQQTNVYYYDPAPNLNRFSTKGSAFEDVKIIKNPELLVKVEPTDVTTSTINLSVDGFRFEPADTYKISHGKLTQPQHAQTVGKDAEAFKLTPRWNKVAHADFYEIGFNGMLYTTIKDTAFTFEDLNPETNYTFKLRAVNKDGQSSWTTFQGKTTSNPLAFAIHGITARTTCANQPGNSIAHLFDFDEGNMWHTIWEKKSVPFDMVIDLHSTNQLDKFNYLPRTGRGNGILLKGKVFYSTNQQQWTDAGHFDWKANDSTKVFNFTDHPQARYIKISVEDGIGGFGSGRELYVFKVPGSKSFLSGDINNDHKIDKNDLTSYMNYTGLRKGDPDFDGYVSEGDVNHNGLIDAQDISVVATQLEGGITSDDTGALAGKLSVGTTKEDYSKEDIVELTVSGTDLKSVNALSFALQYNAGDFEYLGLRNIGLKQMENLTYDRLHQNGKKVLYPTFVNVGAKEPLTGGGQLFVLRFKAKRNAKFTYQITDGLLVDKFLNAISF